MSRKERFPRRHRRARRMRQRRMVRRTNGESLLAMLRWFLGDGGIFAKLKLHGNTTWRPLNLAWLAFCWAWSESRNVTDALETGDRSANFRRFSYCSWRTPIATPARRLLLTRRHVMNWFTKLFKSLFYCHKIGRAHV